MKTLRIIATVASLILTTNAQAEESMLFTDGNTSYQYTILLSTTSKKTLAKPNYTK